MADSRDPRRSVFAVWHWPWWTWGVILPLMIASYPLSIGPAMWAADKGLLSTEVEFVLDIAYMPLALVVSASEMTEVMLYWYLGFWVDLD